MTSDSAELPAARRVADPATPRPSPVALGVAAGLCGGLLFAVAGPGLGDDAYITLDYARNLAHHGHWGVITSRTANTATSPLNVVLLAAVTTVVRDAVLAAGLLLMATMATCAVWLSRIADIIGQPRGPLVVLGVVALACDPLLASTVGLETYLAVALFAGLVRYALVGRWVATGVVAGLLILTRPDLAVVDVVVVLTIASARRRALRSAGVAIAVAGPWHVLSWFVLGSALPDTFPVKVHNNGWVGFHFATGPALYLWYWPVAASLTVLSGLLGMMAFLAAVRSGLRRRGLADRPACQAVVAFALGGLANAAVFAYLATPPAHWYYGPLVAGLTLGAVVAALAVARIRWLPLVAVVLATAAAAGFDALRGIPWETAPMRTNWATTREYQRIAEDISRTAPGAVVVSPSEVGTLAYYCTCQVVDFISDPGRTERFVALRDRQADPLTRMLLRLNHLHRTTAPPEPAEYRLVWEKARPNGPGQWSATFSTSPTPRLNRMRLIPAR